MHEFYINSSTVVRLRGWKLREKNYFQKYTFKALTTCLSLLSSSMQQYFFLIYKIYFDNYSWNTAYILKVK